MSGPLEGVRVVDLTAMLSGPYCSMLLADLGADVVKIEPPHGDFTRLAGPYRADDGPEGLGGYFSSVNRGKRSVVLDLKSDEGRDQLLALVAVADVVVENFNAGVMERFGLGYEELAAHNPRLVYAAIRGYGDARTGVSPYAAWPAYDVTAQAVGGFLSITGLPDGTPIKSGPGIGDIFPATLLTVGILAGLHHAQRTGEGQFVDVAMYDAILSLCERAVYQHSYTGEVPRQLGNSHPILSPFDIFPTADGWVSIAAPNDRFWAALATAIGRPDMATDDRYRTTLDRIAHGGDVDGALRSWLSTRSTAEVVDTLGGLVPVGPVNDVAAIFADPHVAARDMLVQVEQPGSDRPVTLAGQPIKFTRTPATVTARAPRLGEHTVQEVLTGWG